MTERELALEKMLKETVAACERAYDEMTRINGRIQYRIHVSGVIDKAKKMLEIPVGGGYPPGD